MLYVLINNFSDFSGRFPVSPLSYTINLAHICCLYLLIYKLSEKQLIVTKLGPVYEISLLIANSKNHTLNSHAYISSGARGLQLYPYFMGAANALASLCICSLCNAQV